MDKATSLTFSGIVLFLYLSLACGQVPKDTSPSKMVSKAGDFQPHHADPPPALNPVPKPPSAEVATPVTPKAKLAAPAQVTVNVHTILDFAGTVSAAEPDFDIVKAPERSNVSVTKLYDKHQVLIYGMIIPDKVGLYQIALVASGASAEDGGETIRDYAFVDINATDPGTPPPGPLPDPNPKPPPGPLPNPPGPEPPLPTPSPDTYGMYSFSKSTLAKMPTTDPWQPYAITIADCFDKMVAQKSGFTSATKFVEATSSLYKSALGDSYPYWQYWYFNNIKAQLAKINTAGKLPSTVDAHAVAWQEISQSLKEVKQPGSKKVKGAAHR